MVSSHPGNIKVENKELKKVNCSATWE